MKVFLQIYLSLFLLISAPSLCASQTSTKVYDLDGKSVVLEQHIKGRDWTVLMFWASDCHVCNRESQAYVDFSNKHQGKGIKVLGVSLDGVSSAADAKQFIQRNQINFPSLLMDARDAAHFYTVNTGENWIGTPTFMVYAPDGVLKAAQIGAVPPESIKKFIESNR